MNMIEASPVKFYFAKFVFLVVAAMLWLAAIVMIFQTGVQWHIAVSVMLAVFGLACFYFFLVVNDKVKRVAIGKNKIVIIEGDKNSRFKWPEVKSVKSIPPFNLYKLKLRGKKKSIYFFPAKNIDASFKLMDPAKIQVEEVQKTQEDNHF